MKRVVLGKSGIETSYLGLGTSAAYDSPLCPAKLRVEDYPDLLIFAYENGVRLWDTSLTYGTHRAIREVLKVIPRKDVVICSKTTAMTARQAETACFRALDEMGTDYIDIFMMQCVRGKTEFRLKSGALEALTALKERGLVRALGLASHGIGALEAARDSQDLDMILGRINYSGHLMDSRAEGPSAVLAGIPVLKEGLKKLLPRRLFGNLASTVHKIRVTEEERNSSIDLLRQIHQSGKCVLGMKVLGEGHLSRYVPEAVGYVASLPFVSAMVVGCCSNQELTQVIRAISEPVLGPAQEFRDRFPRVKKLPVSSFRRGTREKI